VVEARTGAAGERGQQLDEGAESHLPHPPPQASFCTELPSISQWSPRSPAPSHTCFPSQLLVWPLQGLWDGMGLCFLQLFFQYCPEMDSPVLFPKF
jgi:hypothetical protein